MWLELELLASGFTQVISFFGWINDVKVDMKLIT